jgi:hypothetical protein
MVVKQQQTEQQSVNAWHQMTVADRHLAQQQLSTLQISSRQTQQVRKKQQQLMPWKWMSSSSWTRTQWQQHSKSSTMARRQVPRLLQSHTLFLACTAPTAQVMALLLVMRLRLLMHLQQQAAYGSGTRAGSLRQHSKGSTH